MQALLDILRDKLETKRELYWQARRARNLKELWLVIHYSRGFLLNSPYHGIGLRADKPVDEMTSRQISERARGFVAGVTGSTFERVFLFFDYLTPGPDCRAIWP
jgi:hypothetical protein